MIKKIKIGNKYVGDGQPVFVIAEAGVNHNGNLKLALKLIDAAAMAGADAIKFQTFEAGDVVTRTGKMADYQKRNIGRNDSQLEMLKKLALPVNFYPALINHCRRRKIIFLSTPHGGFNSIEFLRKLNIPAFKFGSGDLTNTPLLEYAGRFRKPIILSTGMATIPEVKAAIGAVKKTGNKKLIVLHCTTNYPCPPEEVNLRAMLTMRKKLKLPIGYSDHTKGIQVSIMAVALGACLIEKHFTLDRNMPGPDHKASLEPHELENMVTAIREASLILGSGYKVPNKSEIPMIKTVRKSIVAAKNIKKGEVLSKKNMAIKRPGTGLSPAYWNKIIGRKATRDFSVDDFIEL